MLHTHWPLVDYSRPLAINGDHCSSILLSPGATYLSYWLYNHLFNGSACSPKSAMAAKRFTLVVKHLQGVLLAIKVSSCLENDDCGATRLIGKVSYKIYALGAHVYYR